MSNAKVVRKWITFLRVGSSLPKPGLRARAKQNPRLPYIYTSYIYLRLEAAVMRKARVFKPCTIQAVRLPKEFRFEVKEVEILRRGDGIILREARRDLARVF